MWISLSKVMGQQYPRVRKDVAQANNIPGAAERWPQGEEAKGVKSHQIPSSTSLLPNLTCGVGEFHWQ
jgi:hypothetical protein